jgi:hypothetical protein
MYTKPPKLLRNRQYVTKKHFFQEACDVIALQKAKTSGFYKIIGRGLKS